MRESDVKLCKDMAAFFRSRGYNPLPSRTDAKRPNLDRYADKWAACLLPSEFDRHATSCMQIMTGRTWGLLVVDLDGPEAIERWATMGRHPRTWVSHSGGGGRHVWFSIPTVGRPISKTVAWEGEGDHSAIEILCDKSLVMAPPSIHPKTGRRYLWLDRDNSPHGVGKPADCPAWVLQLAPVAARPEPCVAAFPAGRSRFSRSAPGRAPGPRLPWREVVRRIDVPALVRSWGVKTVGSPRESGWLSCHAVGREDARPSAAIHAESGFYVDSGSGLRLSLPDLAVACGAYATPEDAIEDLGGTYGRTG